MTKAFQALLLAAAFTLVLMAPVQPGYAQELAAAFTTKSLKLKVRRIPSAPGKEIVVSFGGDVNFARSRQNPLADTVVKFGRFPIERFTETLSAEWNGDVNFVNVETVVSERNGATSAAKTFVFRSHPEQFRHLIKLGVNAFALANNHAYDHGRVGMIDTLDFFEGEDSKGNPLLYAGVGVGAAAFAPKIIKVNGLKVAMASASFGSGGFSPSDGTIGMAYTNAAHYRAVLDGLRRADADLKILSMHYGAENVITLDGGQRALFKRAVEEAGVHLVLGHHPHVVRAVEHDAENGAAIFYSLGNLLFIGGAGKDTAALGRDYGLFGRAYFTQTGEGMRLTALEAVPLKGVHHIPRHPSANRAKAIIGHLNGLSRRSTNGPVQFDVVNDVQPRGLACFAAEPFGPRARSVCCRGNDDLQCALPDLM
ncbi:MAG: CapA family protein [Pseudomonadota bacterium]